MAHTPAMVKTFWCNFLALVLLTGSSGSAFADQNDPRLDALFDALLETADPTRLSETEGRIWEIWHEHGDQDVTNLLLDGVRYMNAGFYGDAMAVFTTLVQQEPEFAEAWNKRATLHYLMGNSDASLADIERTLALEPRHFGALSGLGMVYLQKRELMRAREAFINLLQVHPNSPAARENLRRTEEALRLSFI